MSGSGGATLSIYNEGLPAMLEGMGRLVCLRWYTKQSHIFPKLADFLANLFKVGLAWHMIGIYHSAISAFVEPHLLYRTSNHSVISKLMCHFYSPFCKHFYPWHVECLLDTGFFSHYL